MQPDEMQRLTKRFSDTEGYTLLITTEMLIPVAKRVLERHEDRLSEITLERLEIIDELNKNPTPLRKHDLLNAMREISGMRKGAIAISALDFRVTEFGDDSDSGSDIVEIIIQDPFHQELYLVRARVSLDRTEVLEIVKTDKKEF